MTWLDEAKKRLETAVLSGQASHPSVYAAYVSQILTTDLPRALELLEEAEASVSRCRILAIDCGDKSAEARAQTWLRKLRVEEEDGSVARTGCSDSPKDRRRDGIR